MGGAVFPPSLSQRLPNTGRSSSVSCRVTAPFSWVLVHTRFFYFIFFFCPLQEPLLPQSCGRSVIKSHWPSKSDSLRILSPLSQTPRLGSLLWIPELSQQCENTVWITTNCGKFLKRWEYQTILPASWETCVQVKKQQLESDKNKGLVQIYKRSTSRLYIVTLLI